MCGKLEKVYHGALGGVEGGVFAMLAGGGVRLTG